MGTSEPPAILAISDCLRLQSNRFLRIWSPVGPIQYTQIGSLGFRVGKYGIIFGKTKSKEETDVTPRYI